MRLSERGEKEKGGIIASAQLIESLACSSSTSPFLPLSVSGLADTGHARSRTALHTAVARFGCLLIRPRLPGLSPLHQAGKPYHIALSV